MIALNQSQVERAAKAARDAFHHEMPPAPLENSIDPQAWRDAVTVAAPFLQSPWEPPSEKEYRVACDGWNSEKHVAIKDALNLFVARRNKSLIAAPTRQQQIAQIIRQLGDPDQAAEQICLLEGEE